MMAYFLQNLMRKPFVSRRLHPERSNRLELLMTAFVLAAVMFSIAAIPAVASGFGIIR